MDTPPSPERRSWADTSWPVSNTISEPRGSGNPERGRRPSLLRRALTGAAAVLIAAAPLGLVASFPSTASATSVYVPSTSAANVAVPQEAPEREIDPLVGVADSARQLHRSERHGEAAELLRRAAEELPAYAHWLELSALQAAARAGDASTAAELAEALAGHPVVPSDSVVVERVRAAFRAGDSERALRLAESLPPPADPALWTEHVGPALVARGEAEAAAAGYRAALEVDSVPPALGPALLELDGGWEALAAIGASDLREGRGKRAREMLARAVEAAPASEKARLAGRLAESHAADGAGPEMHAVLTRWLRANDLPDSLRVAMELTHGRWHLRRGETGHAEPPLRRAARVRPAEAWPPGTGRDAAYAAFLLADVSHDRNERAEAARRYERAAAHRGSRYAEMALWRLGLMAFHRGEYAEAEEHFTTASRRFPRGTTEWAAPYWTARSRAAAGDEEGARETYRRLLRVAPFTYYGVRAAEHLGEEPWRGLPSEEVEVSLSDRDLVGRMDRLRAAGWAGRARVELDAARSGGPRSRSGLLALARALNESGWSHRGSRIAWKVFQRVNGEWTRELLEAVYPLPYREAIERAASAAGLDAALLAALVRQESVFDPLALSSAGAVGLMQLMPRTALQLMEECRREGAACAGLVSAYAPDGLAPLPGADVAGRPSRQGGQNAVPGGLTEPELNLALGARYLADLLRRFDDSRVGALISYNAGPRRFLRWRRLPEYEAADELFVERIPYAETRRYVKAIYRNIRLYRALYGLGETEGAAREESAIDEVDASDEAETDDTATGSAPAH